VLFSIRIGYAINCGAKVKPFFKKVYFFCKNTLFFDKKSKKSVFFELNSYKNSLFGIYLLDFFKNKLTVLLKNTPF
jgi:hypothetical protein